MKFWAEMSVWLDRAPDGGLRFTPGSMDRYPNPLFWTKVPAQLAESTERVYQELGK